MERWTPLPETTTMDPWMIERLEQDRAEREWTPEPLHIPAPPPGWAEREQDADDAESTPERGVWVFQM